MVRATKIRKAKEKAKHPMRAQPRRSMRRKTAAAHIEVPKVPNTRGRVDVEPSNDPDGTGEPWYQRVQPDALGLALRFSQAVTLLSLQSMRTWQNAWEGLLRLNR